MTILKSPSLFGLLYLFTGDNVKEMAKFALLVLAFGTAIAGVNSAMVLGPLQDYIKKHSRPDIVPIQTVGTPLEIDVVFKPLNVANLDQKNNALEMHYVLFESWNSGITWNPNNFRGIEYVTLPIDYFWTPSLTPFQAVTEMKDISPPIVTIFNNGTIIRYAVFNSKLWCGVSESSRGATCSVTTAIWAYSKDRVVFRSMSNANMQFDWYFIDPVYTIVKHNMTLMDFPTGGRFYQFVNFQITIEEKPRQRPRIPFKAVFEWH